MLWSDAGVIEPSGDGVGLDDLSVVVLDELGVAAVQHTGPTVHHGCAVVAQAGTASAGFHTDQRDVGVGDEGVEETNGVGAATDTGHREVRQSAQGEHLSAGFPTDHRLELTNEPGVGMRTDRAAQQVEDAFGVSDPGAHGLVDGSSKGAITGGHRNHLCAQQQHAVDVGGLTLNVDSTHVDRAGQTDTGTGGSRSHAMLTGTGFSNDPLLAHTQGQQRLTEGIVDFVRTRVV